MQNGTMKHDAEPRPQPRAQHTPMASRTRTDRLKHIHPAAERACAATERRRRRSSPERRLAGAGEAAEGRADEDERPLVLLEDRVQHALKPARDDGKGEATGWSEG